jgi:hypothetical protein
VPLAYDQRRLVLARGGFSPRDLPGLVLYLRSDAGLFQDTAATTPATADTHPVGLWQDQSGQGNHASQATAGSKPVLRTGIVAGRAAVRSDGLDDYLDLGKPAALNLAAGLTVFTVFALRNLAASGKYLLANFNAAGSVSQFARWHKLTTAQHAEWEQEHTDATSLSVEDSAAIGAVGEFHVSEAVRDDGAKTVQLLTDGAAGGSGSYAAKTVAAYASAGNTALFRGGSFNGAYAAADLCELLVYNAALTASDRSRVRAYLGGRYGITVA